MADMHGVIAKRGISYDAPQLLRACSLSTWTFDHLLAAQPQFADYHQFHDDSPIMDLDHGFSGYLQRRRSAGSTIGKEISRRKRKLKLDLGPLRFVWNTDDPEVFETLCRWKRDILTRQGCADIYSRPDVVGLMRAVQEMRSEAFSGITSALYAGDQLIAGQFSIQSYDVMSAWIPTYNPVFARYSPGTVLHFELASAAAERQIRKIHLGRGENQTKKRLMTSSVRLAVGAIDLHPIPTICRKAWFGLRRMAHSTPLRHGPLRFYRRIRNYWLGAMDHL